MALKKDKIMLGNGFPVLPDFESMETGEATKQDIYDTQGMIAYVQKTLKADQAYTVGDYFIYNGKLYTATANIAKDANIVLTGTGANAELADSIQEQINDITAYTPPGYSNTEYLTGQKWVDGTTDIYAKDISFGALPDSTTEATVDTGLSGVVFVKVQGVAIDTVNGVSLPLPFVTPDNSGNIQLMARDLVAANVHNVSIKADRDRSNFVGYVHLEYYKLS